VDVSTIEAVGARKMGSANAQVPSIAGIGVVVADATQASATRLCSGSGPASGSTVSDRRTS
jgi:hypothetical protein